MEEQPACAFCAGKRGNHSLDRLGLEPSALEQEAPHDPNCPLLNRKPQRRWLRNMVIALLPAAVLVPGCQTESTAPSHLSMGGLDDGTISSLPDTSAVGHLG